MRYVLHKDHPNRRKNAIRAIAALSLDAGPMEIIVRPYQPKRSDTQSARYWAIVSEIAHAWARQGNAYRPPKTWHEYFKRAFIGYDTIEIKGVEIVTAKSSARLNTHDFGDYMTQVEAWAAENLDLPADVAGERY